MKLTRHNSEELKKFQRRALACALFSQLPDEDMDAAGDVVRDFISMAEEAGLLREQKALPVQIYPSIKPSK